MSQQLDEFNDPILEQGHDINVINKKLLVKTGVGSIIFEVILWLFIIPGLIFLFRKISAQKYLSKLQQKIQHNASQIDNYLEQRGQIMQNVASLVEKSIKLDENVMTTVAAYRSGVNLTDETRSQAAQQVDSAMRGLAIQIERYPELQAHGALRDALQQNSYLQKEITAARELYNDSVLEWNEAIFDWPAKMIVAAKKRYTTRIPFAISTEAKEFARSNFFAK
ncbi:LemA family protein [Mycoplasma simbae]|uniref:LemA family protein n=1 Tax=Mycoplasma simbae TaxID=36744 RepID=UPI0004959EAF|nr:LemA family protein [Mycoplasma simbae]